MREQAIIQLEGPQLTSCAPLGRAHNLSEPFALTHRNNNPICTHRTFQSHSINLYVVKFIKSKPSLLSSNYSLKEASVSFVIFRITAKDLLRARDCSRVWPQRGRGHSWAWNHEQDLHQERGRQRASWMWDRHKQRTGRGTSHGASGTVCRQ